MASFTDVMGRTWQVELDGPLMGEIRDAVKVDLADLSGTGYLKIENDYPSLIAALKIICRDQFANAKCTSEQFGKAIRKDTLKKAAEAVMIAAADFFPTETWSEIQSRFESVRKMRADLAELTPMMAMLDSPGVPKRMQDAVMAALSEAIQAVGDNSAGAQSEAVKSAIGSMATQLLPATDSPASAEFDPTV